MFNAFELNYINAYVLLLYQITFLFPDKVLAGSKEIQLKITNQNLQF